MDCVRQFVPEYPAAHAYVQFPGVAEYDHAVAVAIGFPTVRVEMFANDGLAAQDPREAVQVGDAAPFQRPLQVQVEEAPAKGNAGVAEAVPCAQKVSDQNDASE